MTVGELVSANVVDRRVLDAQGETAPAGLYLLNQPGRALPFAMLRAWKVPTGIVSEEVRFIGPSGRTVYRWGPAARRMIGSMDLTIERDDVDDAFIDETGMFVASFILDGEIIGEIEVPVFVQQAPARLSKEIEDGLRKSDVIWAGIEQKGLRTTAPVWFAYRNGRIYVLSKKEPGPEEQTVPGVPGAPEVIVVTRRKLRETALDEFFATVRLLEGAEWEEAAKLLVDRRRSRVGPPSESIAKWRTTCAIAELTPVV